MSNNTYNGHKNWNHWNVSLWINNDQGLYNMAKEYISVYRTRNIAAYAMLNSLHDSGKWFTPDSAPYSYSSVRAAMVGM